MDSPTELDTGATASHFLHCLRPWLLRFAFTSWTGRSRSCMCKFISCSKIIACNSHYLHTNTDVTSALKFHRLSRAHLTVLNFVYHAAHLSSPPAILWCRVQNKGKLQPYHAATFSLLILSRLFGRVQTVFNWHLPESPFSFTPSPFKKESTLTALTVTSWFVKLCSEVLVRKDSSVTQPAPPIGRGSVRVCFQVDTVSTKTEQCKFHKILYLLYWIVILYWC